MAGQTALTREQYLDSIRQLTVAANELAARYNMNQLTWQPAAGERWSMLECLDHLSISTNLYLDAITQATGDARRAGPSADIFRAGGAPSAWFTTRLEPPPSKKVPAPSRIRPRPTLNPEGILPEFRKTMERVSALVGSTGGKDLNSARFRNPLLPVVRFTLASGLLVIAAHCRRHMWQAQQVAKEPGFPAA